MPRGPRELWEQGFYHVIMRGAGKQVRFEDGRDYEAFLQMLRRALERFSLSVMAWCLMSNHVHLLVDDAKGELSGFAHLVSTTYARHFNERWGHVGHVFSSRFTSVAIGSDEQLLATMRYIHQNPSRAGMAASQEYAWSSYSEYVGDAGICETGMVLDLLGGVAGFCEYVNDAAAAPYYPRTSVRVPDEDAIEAAAAAIWPERLDGLKTMSPEARATHLRRLGEAGLSVRQIGRLTGLGRYAIEKALHQKAALIGDSPQLADNAKGGGDDVDLKVGAAHALSVDLAGRLLGKVENGMSDMAQAHDARPRVTSAPRQPEECQQMGERRFLDVVANVEKAVSGVGVRADSEAAAVSWAHLHGEDERIELDRPLAVKARRAGNAALRPRADLEP